MNCCLITWPYIDDNSKYKHLPINNNVMLFCGTIDCISFHNKNVYSVYSTCTVNTVYSLRKAPAGAYERTVVTAFHFSDMML